MISNWTNSPLKIFFAGNLQPNRSDTNGRKSLGNQFDLANSATLTGTDNESEGNVLIVSPL